MCHGPLLVNMEEHFNQSNMPAADLGNKVSPPKSPSRLVPRIVLEWLGSGQGGCVASYETSISRSACLITSKDNENYTASGPF